MPSYELMLLIRLMPKPALVSTLKRTSEAIFDKKGIIRKLENLGTNNIPYKTSAHGHVHRKAHYFLFEFDVPPSAIEDLNEYYGRDVDIVRRRIFKTKDPFEKQNVTCTIDEETKPPVYRKEVQEMIEQEKLTMKPKFKYNSGLDYYPFQK